MSQSISARDLDGHCLNASPWGIGCTKMQPPSVVASSFNVIVSRNNSAAYLSGLPRRGNRMAQSRIDFAHARSTIWRSGCGAVFFTVLLDLASPTSKRSAKARVNLEDKCSPEQNIAIPTLLGELGGPPNNCRESFEQAPRMQESSAKHCNTNANRHLAPFAWSFQNSQSTPGLCRQLLGARTRPEPSGPQGNFWGTLSDIASRVVRDLATKHEMVWSRGGEHTGNTNTAWHISRCIVLRHVLSLMRRLALLRALLPSACHPWGSSATQFPPPPPGSTQTLCPQIRAQPEDNTTCCMSTRAVGGIQRATLFPIGHPSATRLAVSLKARSRVIVDQCSVAGCGAAELDHRVGNPFSASQ